MQEHLVERQRNALPARGMQRHHRQAFRVVARLDAGQQQRLCPERRGPGRLLERLGEIRALDGLLVLDAEQRLARLGAGLHLDPRAGLLGELDQQRPEELHEAARNPHAHLRPVVRGHEHQEPILLGIEIDLQLVQLHGA